MAEQLSVEILNCSYNPSEEFIMEHYSGMKSDCSDRVIEVVEPLDDKHFEDLRGGDWITIVDGEVVGFGEFHPYQIHYQA